MMARPARYYRRFDLRKRSGGTRQVVTPRRFLKTIQRWLLHNVLSELPARDSVHGFVPGRNIFSNAEQHLQGRNLLCVDIEGFFPSVSKQLVVDLLQELPFPYVVATQIAGLATLDGVLPQGAPTSPAIANAAFSSFDDEFEALAAKWECTYTRYADDLAFSGDRPFSLDDIQALKDILSGSAFQLNDDKTRIRGPGQRQMVAGLVVNSSGLPPREVRRRWRAMFHRAARFPREFRGRGHHLGGIAAFVMQYSKELGTQYQEIANQVLALDEGKGKDI